MYVNVDIIIAIILRNTMPLTLIVAAVIALLVN